MEVRAPVAPSVEVDPADIAEREDRALGSRDDAIQMAPGRLPPTGACSVQFSSDQSAGVVWLEQIPHGGPPGSPRRGGSGI